jgi:hypothetical protein
MINLAVIPRPRVGCLRRQVGVRLSSLRFRRFAKLLAVIRCRSVSPAPLGQGLGHPPNVRVVAPGLAQEHRRCRSSSTSHKRERSAACPRRFACISDIRSLRIEMLVRLRTAHRNSHPAAIFQLRCVPNTFRLNPWCGRIDSSEPPELEKPVTAGFASTWRGKESDSPTQRIVPVRPPKVCGAAIWARSDRAEAHD